MLGIFYYQRESREECGDVSGHAVNGSCWIYYQVSDDLIYMIFTMILQNSFTDNGLEVVPIVETIMLRKCPTLSTKSNG